MGVSGNILSESHARVSKSLPGNSINMYATVEDGPAEVLIFTKD